MFSMKKWAILRLHLPCSAISISLRPNSAFEMSLTQKSEEPLEVFCCFSLGEDPSSELSLNASATNGTQNWLET